MYGEGYASVSFLLAVAITAIGSLTIYKELHFWNSERGERKCSGLGFVGGFVIQCVGFCWGSISFNVFSN